MPELVSPIQELLNEIKLTAKDINKVISNCIQWLLIVMDLTDTVVYVCVGLTSLAIVYLLIIH
jgi:hypothetical protein